MTAADAASMLRIAGSSRACVVPAAPRTDTNWGYRSANFDTACALAATPAAVSVLSCEATCLNVFRWAAISADSAGDGAVMYESIECKLCQKLPMSRAARLASPRASNALSDRETATSYL